MNSGAALPLATAEATLPSSTSLSEIGEASESSMRAATDLRPWSVSTKIHCLTERANLVYNSKEVIRVAGGKWNDIPACESVKGGSLSRQMGKIQEVVEKLRNGSRTKSILEDLGKIRELYDIQRGIQSHHP